MTVSFSHVGVCVTDLDRSIRFYVDGLGFEAAESWTIGSDYGTLMELPDVELTSQFLRRDGASIELLHYGSPGTVGSAERRPVNQLGLTHLCFRVDDVEAVASRLATASTSSTRKHRWVRPSWLTGRRPADPTVPGEP